MDKKLYPLAAMAQAVQLILQLAVSGECEAGAFQVNIDSLFVFQPDDIDHIYGGTEHLRLGLTYLDYIFHHPLNAAKGRRLFLMNSFFILGKKIIRSPKIQKKLAEELMRIKQQIDYFGSWQHSRVRDNLAEVYLELATPFKIALKIVGHKKHLQNPEVINKIRLLLFSGVRAAVLWYQLNGNLLWLLWQRKNLSKQIKLINIG